MKLTGWLSMWLHRVPFRTLISVAIALGVLVPAGVGQWLKLGDFRRTLEAQFYLEHQRGTDLIAAGMREPLWTLNHEAGRTLFEAAGKDERVVSAVVLDKQFGAFFSKEFSSRRSGQSVEFKSEVTYNGNFIGLVIINISDKMLVEKLAVAQRTFVLTLFAQVLLSTALAMWVAHLRFFKPLADLRQGITAMAEGETKPLVQRGNEFDAIAQAFERLQPMVPPRE